MSTKTRPGEPSRKAGEGSNVVWSKVSCATEDAEPFHVFLYVERVIGPVAAVPAVSRMSRCHTLIRY